MIRWRFVSTFLLAAAVLPTSAWAAAVAVAEAEAEAEAEFESSVEFEYLTEEDHPAELLLLSPRFESKTIGNVLSAYSYQGSIYLPLYAVSSMLEYGISLGRRPGTAGGFIGQESRTFQLDSTAGTFYLERKPYKFDPNQVQIRRDDLYIESSLLSRWLPVDFEINPYASVVEFKPREPTPLQLRLAREERLRRFGGAGSEERGYSRQSNSYKLFDGPVVDQTFTGRVSRSPGGSQGFGAYSSFIAADLLYLQTNAFLTGNSQAAFSDWRLSMGRKDPYARLLGPLGARELTLVDIYNSEVPMVSRSQELRGGTVSNYPLSRPSELQSHTFRGDLPPGWTVELYRDGFLMDYRTANETGLFMFPDVPLLLGLNRFELVFYGPYGQVRKEEYTFNLADIITAPGDMNYRLTGGETSDGNFLGSGAFDFGLLPWVSGTASITTLPYNGAQHQYFSLGTNAFVDRFYLLTRVAQSSQGGRAYRLGAQTRVSIFNLSSRYEIAEVGYRSEIFHETLKDQLNLGTDIQVLLPQDIPLNAFLGFDRSGFRNRMAALSLANRLSTSIASLSISNRLGYHWLTGTADDPIFEGGLSLSRQVDPRGRVRLSGELNYRIIPDASPTGVSTRLSSNLPQGFIGFTGFVHAFEGGTSYDVGVSKDFENVAARLTGRHTVPNTQEIYLQVSLAVGYVDRQHQSVYADARPYGGNGAALVRAFLDNNGNGVWDPEEPPVANATVFVNNTDTRVSTGKDGYAFVGHLQPFIPTDVALSPTSLEDPAWVSTRKGVNFVPRPGRIWEVDFPIIPTGEIDGTVFFAQRDSSFEQGGITVELLSAKGEVVARQLTAYDGFYLFEKLPFGKYRLRINPDQLQDLKASVSGASDVQLNDKEPVSSGNDITLKAN